MVLPRLGIRRRSENDPRQDAEAKYLVKDCDICGNPTVKHPYCDKCLRIMRRIKKDKELTENERIRQQLEKM